MVLLFEGHTTCGICEKIIYAGEDFTGVPAIANKSHYLYEYFDQGFHQACFENWNEKEEICKVLQAERIAFEQS
jgi:hypothetical protein